METTIQIRNKSELLWHQRFYAPTYLTGDDGSVVLFIGDAAEVKGPKHTRLRTSTTAIEYSTEAEMVDAILNGGWKEDQTLDDNARQWKPAAALTPPGDDR
jgi:hypothetical protein